MSRKTIEWPNIFDEGDQQNEVTLDQNVMAEEMMAAEQQPSMGQMQQNGAGP